MGRPKAYDRDEKLDPWTDFAFVIEDDKDMARRLGAEVELKSAPFNPEPGAYVQPGGHTHGHGHDH